MTVEDGDTPEPTAWIIALAASPDPQHFGPFVDENEALFWGYDNLTDHEPEEWEPYPLSLTMPQTGGPSDG